MNPCRLATEYYDKLSRCKTISELEAVGAQIKADLPNLIGWEQWLRDGYTSCADTINTPKYTDEDRLNKQGLKALQKGEI